MFSLIARRLAVVFLLLLAGPALAPAAHAQSDDLATSKDRVTISARTEPAMSVPGATGALIVTIEVQDGWHIYHPNQAREPYGDQVATRISAAPAAGLAVGAWAFPTDHVVPLFGEPQHLLSGTVEARAPLEVAADATPGPRALALRVSVSTCDDQTCLPGDEIAVAVPVTVAPGPHPPPQPVGARTPRPDPSPGAINRAPTALSPQPATPQPTVPSANEFEAAAARGLWALLALALVAGLGSTLLPCVFPLIPVTVGFFAGQSAARAAGGLPASGGLKARPPLPVGRSGRGLIRGFAREAPRPEGRGLSPQPSALLARTFLLAGTYVAGMVAFYTAIGALAAAAGDPSWLGHPAVTAGIVTLFLVFAVSMFGAFEIQVPGFLRQRLVRSGRQGLGGSFLMGSVMGIASFACVGPFIGAGIAYVVGQPVISGALVFAVFGLGQGAPFLAAVMAGDRLGRPGAWMNDVKHFFGLVFLMASLNEGALLIPADWAPKETVVTGAWAVLLVGTGVFLLGVLRDRAWSWLVTVLRTAAVLMLVFGGVVFASVVLKEGWLLPPRVVDALLAGGGDPAAAEPRWYTDFDAAQAAAQAAGAPMFVDFYKVPCANCEAMDRSVLQRRDFRRAAEGWVLVKLDTSKSDSAAFQRRARDFGTHASPFFGFYQADGSPLRAPSFGDPKPLAEVVALLDDTGAALRRPGGK